MATVNGTAGNDFIHLISDGLVPPGGYTNLPGATDLADVIDAGAGNDIVYSGGGNDSVQGAAGSDTLYGGDGDDIISGGSDEFLGDGSDMLYGGAGNDILIASDEFQLGVVTIRDTLHGGTGDDIYEARFAHVAIVEAAGEGIDTLFVSRVTPVTVGGPVPPVWPLLADNVENLTVSAASSLTSLPAVWYGNSLDNRMTSLGAVVGVEIREQAHTFHGLAGNDTYVFDGSNDVAVEEINAGNDTVIASATIDLNENVENLILTRTGLTGVGNALANTLTSQVGDATLNGAQGADTMYGGSGNDTFHVENAGDQVIELAGSNQGSRDHVISSIAYVLGANLEWLSMEGAATGTGNELNNTIRRIGAQGGTLDGAFGNDTVTGADAADVLIGGQGNDTLSGGGANDTLQGGEGDDRLVGDAGLDRLEGGAGNDTYVAGVGTDTIIELAGGGVDTIEADRDFVLIAQVERLSLTGSVGRTGTGTDEANTITGTSGDDTLRGLGGSDVLQGNGGNDSLDGGTGADVMFGGAGNDRFLVDSAADQVIELPGAGTDTAFASVSYTLGAEVETLVLLGAGGLTGVGNQQDNTLIGTTGNDTLNGGQGADRMEGGTGNDRYVVGSAADAPIELPGGGTDTVEAWVNFTLGDHLENLVLTRNVTVGGAGLTGTGNTLDNAITGTNGVDTLFGGDGNDTLNGVGSDDMMHGGAGNDRYVISGTGDQIVEGVNGGVDTVFSTAHLTILAANVENLIFAPVQAPVAGGAQATGNALDNIMVTTGVRTAFFGLGGNDTLTGGADNDSLYGGDGNDLLDGQGGINSLYGGGGNDTYIVTRSQQVVDERINLVDAGGVDEVRASLGYGLGNFIENLELFGTVGLRGDGNGMDNRIGGTAQGDSLSGFVGNDTLLGRGGDDVLNGGIGTDRMEGGTGNDTYFVDSTLDQVVEAAGEGTDTVHAVIRHTLSNHVENLIMTGTPTVPNASGIGNGLDNTITRASGFGALLGMAGNDTLIGAGGEDSLFGGTGNDRMIGGGGNDRYAVEQAGDVVVEGANGGYDWVTAVIGHTLADNVERLTLVSSTFGLTGTGNTLANLIEGTSFGDLLFGGGAYSGDDTIRGGNGNDTIIGGMAERLLLEGEGGNDRFGFALRDLNEIVPYTPAITINGGIGTDTLDLTNYDRDGVTVDLAAQTISLAGFVIAGIEAIVTGAGSDTVTNAGSASGGAGDDSLSGTAAADVLSGGTGNDTLDGRAGADTMTGGAGNDVFIVDQADDSVQEGANGGIDTVRSTLSYTLGNDVTTGHVENLVLLGTAGLIGTGNRLNNTLTGTAQGDTLRGEDGNDTLIGLDGVNLLQGGAGNDRLEGGADIDDLDGGSGADTMIGGLGTDFYTVDDAGDLVTEAAGGGNQDRVTTGLGSYTLTAHVEQLVGTNATGAALTGNAGNNAVTGADGNDTLSGLDGDDILEGGAGNDTLSGGNGADTLNGGTGDNVLEGGADDDVYFIASSGDQVIELAGGGKDTVIGAFSAYTLAAEVEDLTSTFAGSSQLFGNQGDNVILSNAGNDTLFGGEGNDTLVGQAGNDTLYGGGGNDSLIGRSSLGTHSDLDTLQGGAGNDTYTHASVGTVIIENANDGIDTVISLLPTYVLVQNIENAFAFTAANATLVGNTLDNSLGGGLGSDTLIGGAGNDTLTGNAGVDGFVFNAAGGADRVTDMVSGTDRLLISATTFGIGNQNVIIDLALSTTTGGWSGANELVIFSQNLAGLSAAEAAAGAGIAGGAVATGQRSIMVFDNGTDSAIYQFTAQNNDNVVSAAELVLLITLQGTAATQIADYTWIG